MKIKDIKSFEPIAQNALLTSHLRVQQFRPLNQLAYTIHGPGFKSCMIYTILYVRDLEYFLTKWYYFV